MKYIIFILSIIFSTNLNAQENDLVILTKLFTESIASKDVKNTKQFLNIDIKNDSTYSIIKNIQESIKEAKDIKFYIVKINAPIPVYNINIYDAKTIKQYGDLRIGFDNENLINRLIFFDHVEKKMKLKNISPLLPPPPPPHQ